MKNKPNKFEWTKQQVKAIKNRGSDLFVTASAGTGKTAVLSGRCADLVSEKTEVRSMLVLTFTDAAAEQMRQRIAQQMQDAYASEKDTHLRRQLLMLAAADISTIHSFCKRLITEFFFKLSLDPTFRIIDEDEQQLLKAEVLEQTLDWAWSQPNLTDALEQLLYRRSLRTNDGFAAHIIRIHDFLENVVNRDQWFQKASDFIESKDPFKTDLAERQKQILAEKINDILSQLRHAGQIVRSQNPTSDWLDLCNDKLIPPIQESLDLLGTGQWEDSTKAIITFKKPTVKTPADIDKDVAKFIHDTAKSAIDNFAGLTELAILNADYLKEISGSVSLQTRVLLEMVKKFSLLYTKAKQNINALDFSDLEHYAMKLLTDDTGAPSETALLLRSKYKYIFVDEYQDINPVQKHIIDSLHSKDNIFVVGDIKQSIYAFRGAEPGIFLENIKQASTDPKKATSGYRIDLNKNFRSEKPILDFVNLLFSRIMTAPLAKLDYDDAARLRPSDEHSPETEPLVEVHILDAQEKNSKYNEDTAQELQATTKISSRQQQAALIAQRIKKMVGTDTGKTEFQIYDKYLEQYRDVQFRDIVILMRSPSSRADDYVQILQLAGISVTSEFGAGYFQATEIADLLALLKVLDNPQRDIELAAVLRSPFFNFTDTELAKIKLYPDKNNDNSITFYSSIINYAENGPDKKLIQKTKDTLAQILTWRTTARQGSLADLIWKIYRQTNYLSFVTALPNGQLRKANLLKLHDRAIQFEGFASSSSMATLTRFVEFLEKLDEAGREWAPAKPQSAAENAVRIMSIHKSKGLEFPVVFIAEMNTTFNIKEKSSDCLTSPTCTLGLQIIDQKTNSKISSLAHQIIIEEKATQQLAEEMRILYVAATRPMQRLVLTGSIKQNKCRHMLTEGFCFGPDPIAPWKLRSCRSALEWLLYGLSYQTALHKCFDTPFTSKAADDHLFTTHLYDQDKLNQLSDVIQKLRNTKRRKIGIEKTKPKTKKSETFNKVKDAIFWRYHFGDAPLINAKRSVTALTHPEDEFSSYDYSQALAKQPKIVSAAAPLDARLIGTATHLIIANLDLSQPTNKTIIENTIQQLIKQDCLTEPLARHIDTDSIISFFDSDLGKLALENKENIFREWPFTLALPASQLPHAPSGIDDSIIVQGIIDMLISTPNGLVIIDFKTDSVSPDQVKDRADSYRPQLQLYAKAAQKILNKKIAATYLYFLSPRCEREVKQ
ncbi:MAG: helicase-exonuclease AddAB subunit AddA [Planctomycetota bacterium]|jgi:ATP-dependent helicase/nuclease subunit A